MGIIHGHQLQPGENERKEMPELAWRLSTSRGGRRDIPSRGIGMTKVGGMTKVDIHSVTNASVLSVAN